MNNSRQYAANYEIPHREVLKLIAGLNRPDLFHFSEYLESGLTFRQYSMNQEGIELLEGVTMLTLGQWADLIYSTFGVKPTRRSLAKSLIHLGLIKAGGISNAPDLIHFDGSAILISAKAVKELSLQVMQP